MKEHSLKSLTNFNVRVFSGRAKGFFDSHITGGGIRRIDGGNSSPQFDGYVTKLTFLGNCSEQRLLDSNLRYKKMQNLNRRNLKCPLSLY